MSDRRVVCSGGARSRLAGVVVLFGTLLASSASAQPADDLVKLHSQKITQQVRREVAEFERQCYTTAPPAKPGTLPPDLAKAVAVELDRQAAIARSNSPDATGSTFRKERVSAWAYYESTLHRRFAFQNEIELRQMEEGFRWDTKTEAPFRFGIADGAALMVFVVVAFIARRIAAKESRLANRRARRARGLVASILIGISTLSSGGCENSQKPAHSWSQSRTWELEPELKTATAQAEEAVAAADAERAKFIERRVAMVPGANAEQEREVLAKARDTLFMAKNAERMAQAAEEERAKLEADIAALASLRSSNRWHTLAFLGLRIAAALLLGAVALWPFLRSHRTRNKQKEAAADTCPRCLAVGKLVEQSSALKDDRYTEARIVECRACEYRFREVSRGEARLCFPTVGVRSSGKTHMLATAYAAAKKGQTRTTARMLPAPSLGDERFNVYIELILKQRGTAGATVHGQRAEDMPYPILFSTTDTDSAGNNSVMVNLFDYSGEMMGESLDVGLLRRRAVLMDGFLLFFDPTQMYGDTQDGEATLSIEDQLKALSDFAHDMEAGRKLKQGSRIDVPVAVCISKFDMVATHSPMGGQALPFLEHIRTSLNPPGPVSLELLRARSATVEQMLPFMLPGIDLGKILREHFGHQFLFFPTSDRGFASSAPGWKSESGYRPTPVPFGVMEPILWLLHMHGYETLDVNGTSKTIGQNPAKPSKRPTYGTKRNGS